MNGPVGGAAAGGGKTGDVGRGLLQTNGEFGNPGCSKSFCHILYHLLLLTHLCPLSGQSLVKTMHLRVSHGTDQMVL